MYLFNPCSSNKECIEFQNVFAFTETDRMHGMHTFHVEIFRIFLSIRCVYFSLMILPLNVSVIVPTEAHRIINFCKRLIRHVVNNQSRCFTFPLPFQHTFAIVFSLRNIIQRSDLKEKSR